MESLKNKKILFIGPEFYKYHLEISKNLETSGAIVHFYNEDIKKYKTVASIYLLNTFFKNIISKIYFRRLEEMAMKNTYDYVLVIKAEYLPINTIKLIKTKNPQAQLILYLWDSIENYKQVIEKIPFFNKCFSFDPTDSEKYNLYFRPLFWIPQFETDNGDNHEEIDLLFAGMAHGDRLRHIKRITENEDNRDLKFYIHLIIRSKLIYIYRKYIKKELKNTKMSDFKYNSLSFEEVIKLVNNSKAIIDISQPTQKGLSIRVIEMIGARKKIITTNLNIVNYDFFDSANIKIIEDLNFSDLRVFIESPYRMIDDSIREKYSLTTWVADLFYHGETIDNSSFYKSS